MTVGSFVPARMVQEAEHWANLGYHEGPNNENVFSRWQYGDTFEPWCDSFVSYCAWMGGFRFPPNFTFGEKGDNNVGLTHQHAIQDGLWRPASMTARAGWLVVFTFGIPDEHIEMVLSDSGGPTIQTIGGNTGNEVAYRTRQRGNVVGFVALDEAGQNAPTVGASAAGGDTVKITDRTDAAISKAGGTAVLGADGGVFVTPNGPGDKLAFHGSVPGTGTHFDLTKTWATSILLTPDEGGYWVLGANGDVFSFGDAQFHGTFHGELPLATAVTLVADGLSYKAIRDDGKVLNPVAAP